ncbi:MATE family efflux transporter [Haladaptatus sp. R4]|uniref:MATE family efflux transporter n=1 Tax=Haladaptatus sp. R4 TaxID=1679489 RepID=UPI0007B47E7F|nr:MATE family efflux transporter [Haladaptatus sp. R4]KZN25707.1 MATE family efflux transporter [Haladaptatus sp. R4]
MSAGSRDLNLTDGDLYKPLLILSAPIVASQLMQVVYNLADTFWVGQIGPGAVSAVSYAFPIIFLLISLGTGFSIAGTALVSQNKGAGNHERVDHVAGQTISFTLLASLVFAVIGYLAAPTLVSLIGTTPGTQIYRWTVEFTRTTFLGVFFMFGFFMFQALLRGWGDTRTPMYLMAFGVTLNIVLDPFFVYGFTDNLLLQALGLGGLQTTLFDATGFAGFGVQGAAIATVLSRGIAAVIGLTILFSGRVGIHLSFDDVVPEPETVKKIVRIGVPASVDMSMRALGITFLTAIVAMAGDPAVAAYGIGNRLNSLVFLPSIGLAQGTTTMVGQNLGADKPERSERAVYYASATLAVVLVVVSVVAWHFAEPLIGIFVGSSENFSRQTVIHIGAQYLRIIGPTFLFLGVFRVVTSAFRGAGDTTTAMVFTILSLWVFRLPVAYYLLEIRGMGPTGVWYAIAFSNVAAAVIAFLWFRRGTWKTSEVEGANTPSPAD